MEVKDIVEKMELEVFSGAGNLDKEVKGGYASDLLSDVLGFADEGYMWITLQTHKNVVAVASLKKLSAIVLVKGNRPESGMLAQAQAEGIPVLGTAEPAFETIGRIYALLNA